MSNQNLTTALEHLQDAAMSVAVAQIEFDGVTAERDAAMADLTTATTELGRTITERDDARADAQALAQALAQCEAGQPPVDPPDPVSEPIFGTSFGTGLPINIKTVKGARIYCPPGNIPAKWGDHSKVKIAQSYGCTDYFVSFKDADAAKIRAFLAGAPKNTRVTYFHEHEGNIRVDKDLTVAQYVAGTKVVADVAHSMGLRYGPIHNGLNRLTANDPWAYGNWIEADVALYDFWGFDGYAPKTQDPQKLYQPAIDYAKKLGLPIVHAELAAPAGAAQDEWAALMRQVVLKRENNYEAGLWWDEQVSASKPDYNISAASAAAFFAL